MLQHTATHCNTRWCVIEIKVSSRCKSLMCNAATRCSALQHAATHCNTLQHTATHVDVLWTWPHLHVVNLCGLICNALQYTAKHCSTLQHIATHIDVLSTWRFLHIRSPQSVMLQHTATHCNTLQHTATHCNTHWYLIRMKTSSILSFDKPDISPPFSQPWRYFWKR